MKRRKKTNPRSRAACLFEIAPVRQEEESRRKLKTKPVEALKTAAPIPLYYPHR